MDQVGWETFADQLNQSFRIRGEFGQMESTLIECNKLVQHDEEGRVPFSIVLRGSMEPVLEQRIYKVSNQKIGELEIFLVPLGPDKTGMKYEAVFA